MATPISAYLINVRNTAGTIIRNLQAKLYDQPPSLKDFGAVGDGVADDTAAIQAAEAHASKTIFVPEGNYYSPSLDFLTLTKKYAGPGALKLNIASGVNPRGKYFSVLSSDPGAYANNGAPHVGFKGDWSKTPIAIEYYITGANTLGEPVRADNNDYWRQNSIPVFVSVFSDSGMDETVTGASPGRRTSSAAVQSNMNQAGHGDAACFNANCVISGTQNDPVNTLTGKAGVLYNGQVESFIPYAYMNPIEINMHDNGYQSCSAAGAVFNFYRTQISETKYPFWYGIRLQAQSSTVPCDVAFSAIGKWKHGLDLTYADLDVSSGQRAITMRAGDTIYFCAFRNDPSGQSRFPVNQGSAFMKGATDTNNGIWIGAGGSNNITVGETTTELYKNLRLMNVSSRNYADNAAALAAGLIPTDVYHTNGTLKIVL